MLADIWLRESQACCISVCGNGAWLRYAYGRPRCETCWGHRRQKVVGGDGRMFFKETGARWRIDRNYTMDPHVQATGVISLAYARRRMYMSCAYGVAAQIRGAGIRAMSTTNDNGYQSNVVNNTS